MFLLFGSAFAILIFFLITLNSSPPLSSHYLSCCPHLWIYPNRNGFYFKFPNTQNFLWSFECVNNLCKLGVWGNPLLQSTPLYVYFTIWLYWYNTRQVFVKFSSYSLMQEWFLGHRYISIRVLETFQHSKGKIRTLLPPTSHIVCKYTLKMFSLYTAGRDWLKFRAPTQCSTSNTAMWDAPVEQRKPDPVSWAGDEDMETLLASHRQCHRALRRNSTCKIN